MSTIFQSNALKAIKLIHTIAWAFFAFCVLAIAPYSWRGNYFRSLLFIGIVFVEVLVLAFNRWRCPLTSLAARYTSDQPANFDIYLPEWLARYNKHIFGGLYIAGILFVLVRWMVVRR